MFSNPGPRADTIEEVNRALKSWTAYSGRPERCQTVLIVVMKNHLHLVKLQRLLGECDLADVSALVVDDEGDQAGLNNKVRQKAESTTYTRIRLLRQILPTHTYVLYTATPQAPLLISRIDMLSPQFADPIEPGEAYIGGKDLFTVDSPYIQTIPSTELPDDDAPPEPPASLEKALRLFFIGVAAGCANGPFGNRSMMIHPSSLRDWHQQFVTWVRSARTTWLAVLREKRDTPDKRELIDAFREDYKDLAQTEPNIPPFEKILEELEYAIDQTQIKEVNARAGRIPTVLWNRNYSFILVGGTGLDRGFTVEGLTVTYMPRGAGVGNADTVQQRGRFFGYKRDYLGFVRIFLEQSVEMAFRNYVTHEQSIRKSLALYRDSGKPLADWRRAFFLDRSMSPTRSSVLALDYMRGRSREWIYPKRPQSGDGVLKANVDVLAKFLGTYAKTFHEDSGSKKRTKEQVHHVSSSIPLEVVYRDLMVPMMAIGDDLLDHIHVLLQIERELERKSPSELRDCPVAGCVVYLMSKGQDRKRTVDARGAIKALLQGRNDATGYPGDREVRDSNAVTVQIHMLHLVKGSDESGSETLARKVPCLAVSMPVRMRGDVVAEPIK
jgi:hypothetical protein